MALLRRITELVDKDVASNPRPISILGVIIPFVPFIIFVDGAPADSHPELFALALTVSISWGLFVAWRYLRHLQVELAGPRKILGTGKFWLLMGGTIMFVLLLAGGQIWLSDKIEWPNAYGFDCQGRGCFFEDLAHSPELLRGGSIYELALFALLWLLPVILISVLVYALFKRFTHRRHR